MTVSSDCRQIQEDRIRMRAQRIWLDEGRPEAAANEHGRMAEVQGTADAEVDVTLEDGPPASAPSSTTAPAPRPGFWCAPPSGTLAGRSAERAKRWKHGRHHPGRGLTPGCAGSSGTTSLRCPEGLTRNLLALAPLPRSTTPRNRRGVHPHPRLAIPHVAQARRDGGSGTARRCVQPLSTHAAIECLDSCATGCPLHSGCTCRPLLLIFIDETGKEDFSDPQTRLLSGGRAQPCPYSGASSG
jgi:hypothetical protein